MLHHVKHISVTDIWIIYLWTPHPLPLLHGTGPLWWLVNIGSGKGLVPSGYKPLPELMLTKFYDSIWCH